VTKAGKCYTWGCNIFSRLGIGNNIKNQKYPIEVKIF
jgi:alpha-tubulin suppressor-like RCC1 family protein